MKFDWRHPWVLVIVVCIALLLTACGRKELDLAQELEVKSCIAKLQEDKNFKLDTVQACRYGTVLTVIKQENK